MAEWLTPRYVRRYGDGNRVTADSPAGREDGGRWSAGRRIVLVLLLAVGLLWPVALYQRPAYYFDSLAYLKQGGKGVALFEARLAQLGIIATSDSTVQAMTHGPVAARNVRSLTYSLFAYFARWPSGKMIALVVVQSLVIAWLVALMWEMRAPRAPPAALALGAVVLLAGTTAPWFVSFAMPDIFAGALVVALLLLAFDRARLHWGEQLALAAVATFAVSAHASHILVALLMLGAFALGQLWARWRRSAPLDWRGLAWLAGPIALGTGMILALSISGFGEVSVAPKRYPFLLARSIEDGPGRWWLAENCATHRYTVCKFAADLPNRANILFGPDGLTARATPEELDAMRAEEAEIVRAATLAYPLHQVRSAASSTLYQITSFKLVDAQYRWRIIHYNDTFLLQPTPSDYWLQWVFDHVILGVLLLSLGYLAISLRSMNRRDIAMLALLTVAILGNAALTASLSAVANRYQARVIWIVPVVAVGFWAARRQRPAAAGAPLAVPAGATV